MNKTRGATLLTLAAVVACCGACDGWCDVGSYPYQHDFGFRISPDTGGPTNAGPYGLCKVGRVRKLSPRLLTRGTGTSCGANCRQVTFPARSGGSGTLQYDLWDEHLVYRQQSQKDLYLVDLKADKEWALVEHPPKNRFFELKTTAAALYQGRVAYGVSLLWTDSPGNILYTSLLVYDIATQQETMVGCWSALLKHPIKVRTLRQIDFSEAGLVYAWGGGEAAGYATYHLDLVSGKEALVGETDQAFRLWDKQMVWYDGVKDVKLADLSTGNITNLSNHAKRQWQPSIWKDQVVWTDHRDNKSGYVSVACGDTDIYLYDLTSKKLEPVTALHPSQQDTPDLHGDLVAWIDYRDHPDATPCGSSWVNHSDVFVKDLKTGKTQKLNLSPGPKEGLRVWGGQVFYAGWTDKGETAPAIFAVKVR